MGRINISETQFAFAFFHHYLLINKDTELKFVFPTLREEGSVSSTYAGADLVVSNNLFFQFKMPEYLRTRGAIEIINGKLNRDFIPFYRLPIKNSPKSHQFNLLKEAALLPNARARYIAPMFHKDKNDDDEEAFYNFFRLPSINAMQYVCSIDFEQFIKPDYVLSKDDSHKICYSAESIKSNTGYIFSSPTAIEITNSILELQQERLIFDDIPEQFSSLDETITSIRNIFPYSNDTILNTTNDKISLINTIQLQILSIHNIFWIPVLRSKDERRNRLISPYS